LIQVDRVDVMNVRVMLVRMRSRKPL
jgi:hypothetical protein